MVLAADDEEGRVYWGLKQAGIPVCVECDSTLLSDHARVADESAAVGVGVPEKAHGGFLFVVDEPILVQRHVLVWRNHDTSDVTSATPGASAMRQFFVEVAGSDAGWYPCPRS